MSWTLNRWFNFSPFKGAEYIKSAEGERFWILWRTHDEDIAMLRIYYYRQPVGHINVVVEENNVLCLADIFINKKFQGVGLGKQMMKLFIARAKQMSYREIYGYISASEGNSFEYLQEWYSRQGFTVDGKYILLKFHMPDG